jgi:hypothetical protein
LETELIEFQESSAWVNKFVKLGEALEEIECAVDAEYSTQKPENLILEQWNSLPQKFSAMKKLATAQLTLFGYHTPVSSCFYK